MSFLQGILSRLQRRRKAAGGDDLNELQIMLGYRFNDPALLELSLTHRSFCFGHTKRLHSNERLEFLGDSVLGLVIADFLYKDYPQLREGDLTKTKAMLVNETTLAAIGRNIGLNNFIRLSAEEDRAGGRQRPSIISDAVEAVIGAVFLDGGVKPAGDLIFRLIYANKMTIISDESQRNFKGELLELAQAKGDGMPHYIVASEDGPDHHKKFRVEVSINGHKYGYGEGFSKKEAEQKAAAKALESLSAGQN